MTPTSLHRLAALAALALAVLPTTARAKVGPDQIANGADGAMAGFLPPPGVYFLNNLAYVQGTRHDASGREVVTPGGTPGVSGVGETVRLVWVSDRKVLGGHFAMQVVLPFTRTEFNAAAGTPSRAYGGMGDVQLAPAMLGWHLGARTHLWAMVGIFVPIGGAQLSAGYASLTPALLGTHVFATGTEVSGKLAYNLKAVNPTTQYESGDEFLTDFFVGQRVGTWTLGLGGYFVAQTTPDRNQGDRVNGTWTRGLGLGPQVTYRIGQTGLALLWDRDLIAENRFKGDRVIFKIFQPL